MALVMARRGSIAACRDPSIVDDLAKRPQLTAGGFFAGWPSGYGAGGGISAGSPGLFGAHLLGEPPDRTGKVNSPVPTAHAPRLQR